MLSKTKYTQLAAVAALTVLFGTNAGMTTAQAQGNQPTQIEKQQSGQSTTRSGDQGRDASSTREIKREGSSTQMRTDRSRDRTSTQTTVRRDRDSDRTRVTIRDRDRDHDRFRFRHGRESFGAAFIVIGPRHHYRRGWCRGLHRGYHWAPGIGRHAGRHFGLFRC